MLTAARSIDADCDRVWQFLSDLDAWDELLPTIETIDRVDGAGPVTIGSRFRIRQQGLAEATYEITSWQPGEGFVWQATMPGVRTVASHELHEDGSGCRLALGITWHGPLAWLVRLAFRGKTRRFLDQEAESFARLAEAG